MAERLGTAREDIPKGATLALDEDGRIYDADAARAKIDRDCERALARYSVLAGLVREWVDAPSLSDKPPRFEHQEHDLRG